MMNTSPRSKKTTLATLSLVASIGISAVGSASAGQSATVYFDITDATLAPGETTEVRVMASYNLAGETAGLFGTPGLFGFGGDIAVTGDAAPDVSLDARSINPLLTSGATLGTIVGSEISRIGAGRGLDGGVGDNPAELFRFDITADADAEAGGLSLSFSGAVVLALNNRLDSHATAPGVNQSTLSVTAGSIQIAAGCNAADIAPPFGVLDLSDISLFINSFVTTQPPGDIDGNGVWDLTDINLFIVTFTTGCP